MGYIMAADQSSQGPPLDGVEQRYKELFEGAGDRWYCAFKRGHYLFPLDENALDSMDIFHKVITMARRNDTLHNRPIPGGRDVRVLDLGCGTGIWAIDVANKLLKRQDIPDGGFKVIGADLALLQPRSIPKHLRFDKMDMEDATWGFREKEGTPFIPYQENSFDLIGLRMLLGGIKEWKPLYQRIFRHLKPGTGQFEHVEVDWKPRCDDGTMPADSMLQTWSREFLDAMDAAGRSATLDPIATRDRLRETGFVDIAQERIKLPVNGWPEPPEDKQLGRWVNLALTQTIDGLSMLPLVKMGKSDEEIRTLVSKVTFESCNRNQHAYFHLYIWNARRPENPSLGSAGPARSTG